MECLSLGSSPALGSDLQLPADTNPWEGAGDGSSPWVTATHAWDAWIAFPDLAEEEAVAVGYGQGWLAGMTAQEVDLAGLLLPRAGLFQMEAGPKQGLLAPHRAEKGKARGLHADALCRVCPGNG